MNFHYIYLLYYENWTFLSSRKVKSSICVRWVLTLRWGPPGPPACWRGQRAAPATLRFRLPTDSDTGKAKSDNLILYVQRVTYFFPFIHAQYTHILHCTILIIVIVDGIFHALKGKTWHPVFHRLQPMIQHRINTTAEELCTSNK